MAERKVSIREFVEWIILQIDPAVLSELMTAYGYTDDSVESVMNALETKPEFVNDLAIAFRDATEAKKIERRRIVGGYQQVDEGMTFDDWMNILLSGKMEFATGSTGLDSTTPETEKKKVDYVAILSGFASVLGSIFGLNNNQNQSNQQYQQPVQQSGSTTFIWIILGVVVVSVIAIFAITLSKKK